MTTRLVLVRHGESEWNTQRRLQGHGGSGLSELGRRQAVAVADYLQHAFARVDLVVASDLLRATQTAEPWVSRVGADVRVDAQWREIDVGTWSGRTWAEIEAFDPQRYAAWRAGEDVRRGGGETFAEFRVRTATAMDGLRDVDGTVVVFTHGGSVRFATAEVLALPTGNERVLRGVANCSVTQLHLAPDGDTLVSYNVPVRL